MCEQRTQEEQKELTRQIRVSAMDLLSRREHTQRELVQKLKRKYDDESLIHKVLTDLVERDWLNESRACEQLLRAKIQKGYGRYRIFQEAREKGLSDTLISDTIAELQPDWFEQAVIAYRKRFGQRVILDPKDKAKRMRYMQYRGFSFEEIAYAIEQQQSEILG